MFTYRFDENDYALIFSQKRFAFDCFNCIFTAVVWVFVSFVSSWKSF